MKSIPSLFVASATLAILTACGGGGSSTPAPTATAVAITSSNQATVARATVDGGLALTQSQGLAADNRATAQSVQASAPPTRIGAIETVIRRALDDMFDPRRTVASAGANARPSAASSHTANCAAGGSLTTTVDDHDNSGTLSAGDSLTIAFTQCKDSASDLINGTLAFTISSVASATASRVEFSGDLAFQQVSVAFGKTSASINGSVGLYALKTSANLQLSLTVGSGGLTVSASSPGYTDTIVYEAGMQIVVNETTTVPSTKTVTLNGSFTATSLGGRVTVATLQPITQLSSDAYPNAGQVLITGAAGSKLRITAIDSTQVRLELDANGDGTYETVVVVTWASMLPA